MNITENGILKEIENDRFTFSLVFLSVFTVVFVALSLLGLTPDPLSSQHKEKIVNTPVEGTSITSGVVEPIILGEEPVKIEVHSISLSASVGNPATTSIEALDKALLSGAVRYPTSALLGVSGTVLLFGHSSYLPVVHNQAYKAFDGIQDLSKGDEIRVYSVTKDYRYKVTSVKKANAEDADSNTIALPQDGQHLILVTCDSFGSKTDRFVVTADLVGTYVLTQN